MAATDVQARAASPRPRRARLHDLTYLVSTRPRRDVLAFVFFLAVTAFWFHHLIAHLGDAVLVGPNDESYGIRQYWGNEHIGKTPFTAHRDPLNGAPEGLPLSSAVQTANAVIPGTIWVLHWLVGFTAAANLFLLGGFVLTGFATYLLLERLGFHPLAAVFAGYALAFNPWMTERAYAGHGGFMQAWVFPLQIAALIYAHRRQTVLSAVLSGAALTLAFYVSSYYGLLAALVFVVFWVVDFARRRGREERLWSFTLADISFATAVVLFVPALFAWRTDKSAVSASISNPLQDLQDLGASPESYILPSSRHPVLGAITDHFDRLSDSHWAENTLYLGWTLIALGIVGGVYVVRRHPETLATPVRRFFLVAMTVLAPAAFLCSLKRKTQVLGVELPMPSYVIGEFTTFWRVFARFGLLVILALAALAAVVLTDVIRRRRHGLALAGVAFALLAFEYTSGTAPAYRFEATAYSRWLAGQPPGIVANYPAPADSSLALRLLANTFYQQIFNKHPQFFLFGSGYGGTREDNVRILARYITDPDTPSILRAEDVRYVLLHDDVYLAQGNAPPPVPAGLHLVARLPGNVRALELDDTVQPADLPVLLDRNAATVALAQALETPSYELHGASSPFTRDGADGWRRLEPGARIDLRWHDTRLRRAQLVFETVTADQDRTLQLVNGAGEVLREVTVTTRPTKVLLGAFDLHGSAESFQLRVAPSGTVDVGPITVQPLADSSRSIRDD